jgi:hypothetical protein
MLSRRKALLSAIGFGDAAGIYGLDRAHHVLPLRNHAAEERFGKLQDALLANHGMTAVSQFFSLPDPAVRVHVIEAGQGEPVLLVHGGNSVAASWTPLLARLHRRFHLYAPDRPGCGLTTKFNYLGVPLRQHAVAPSPWHARIGSPNLYWWESRRGARPTYASRIGWPAPGS